MEAYAEAKTREALADQAERLSFDKIKGELTQLRQEFHRVSESVTRNTREIRALGSKLDLHASQDFHAGGEERVLAVETRMDTAAVEWGDVTGLSDDERKALVPMIRDYVFRRRMGHANRRKSDATWGKAAVLATTIGAVSAFLTFILTAALHR